MIGKILDSLLNKDMRFMYSMSSITVTIKHPDGSVSEITDPSPVEIIKFADSNLPLSKNEKFVVYVIMGALAPFISVFCFFTAGIQAILKSKKN